jgi:hypothetical protein
MLANLTNGLIHDLAAHGIEFDRSLFESPPFFFLSLSIARKKWGAVDIVIPINCASHVAVQPRAVRAKHDQVGQRDATLVEFLSHRSPPLKGESVSSPSVSQ